MIITTDVEKTEMMKDNDPLGDKQQNQTEYGGKKEQCDDGQINGHRTDAPELYLQAITI